MIIQDDVVYLSKSDISNFFDKYLYYDEQYNQYITTGEEKQATIKLGESKITINGITSDIKGRIIQKGENIYLPISDMQEVYNIKLENLDNVTLIDSLDREQIQADVTKKVSVKIKAKEISRTVDTLEQGDKVVWISENNNWVKVRTQKGKIGYVKSQVLTNKIIVREEKQKNVTDEKISLVWDYYSEYAKVPNRQGTTINGINVISPAFFVLEKLGNGNIIDKANGVEGIQYVNWAKQNGYKVWAMLANDAMIQTTSTILNDYELRNKLIEKIITLASTYRLDGINIDFENMYIKDKDLFSRFIIELYPRLKEKNIILSVDVTAPDGGGTWSECYNRNVIADNCDYILFMGYDQTTANSTKAGTTAGFNWVERNVNKFLGQEGVAKEKLILAIPFYSRLWSEDETGKVDTPKTVNMKDVNNAIPQDAERIWDEVLRQYYVQYEEDKRTRKIWIEDLRSIKEKLTLAKEKELAGVAFWSLDRQDDSVWNEVNSIIFNR